MAVKIVECIPNFSEARRPEVVDQIIQAVASVPGVRVLDHHSDMDHNRTVLTYIGDPVGVEEAAFRGIAEAAKLIDLNVHQGEHPRMGATDVVPFVPISGVTMQECVEMARRLGKRVAAELQIPIYFYEEAAIRADRVNLEDIRRGEYEGIKASIATDPYRAPDLGPLELGPAGATVIGARQALVAYNIFLNTPDVSIAEKIARRARNSTGGFHYVKAMGVLVNGLAQVSMNLTNYHRSPMAQVTEMIRREAQRYGVGIHHSEIVGLIPGQALINAARYYMQLDGYEKEQLLENRIFSEAPEAGKSSAEADFMDEVAAGTPAPGGGSVAAHNGALGGGLVLMTARLTVGKARYQASEAECYAVIEEASGLMEQLRKAVAEDAAAFDAILQARRLPKESDEQKAVRQKAMEEASLNAALLPLQTSRACLRVMQLALRMAEIGNINTISDAASGVHTARAGLEAAGLNVKVNLLGYEDNAQGNAYISEWRDLAVQGDQIMVRLAEVLRERSGL